MDLLTLVVLWLCISFAPIAAMPRSTASPPEATGPSMTTSERARIARASSTAPPEKGDAA